jgi:hypothetical protein
LPNTPKLPTIPTPPGGQSPSVSPASYASPVAMALKELEPHVKALHESIAPSARLTAAMALAQCRHASTDYVKTTLFQAAKTDPCPAVRAACIEHLSKLGYYHPDFVVFVKASCDDQSDEIRAAAKAAQLKMMPRQW